MTDTTLPNVEEPKEEVMVTPLAIAEASPPVKKMHVLICYDDSTGKITLPLDRHLQLLYRRLGSQVERHYFRYRTIEEPKPYTGDNQYFKDQYAKEKAAYEEQIKDYNGARAHMIRFLQQDRLLLILYVSNAMMEHLWKDMDQDAELSSLFANPNHRIAPVLISPTAGFASNCEPLSAFEGTAFETACQQIATNLEAIARDYFGEALKTPDVTPFTLLTSPTVINVSVPSKSDQASLRLGECLGSMQAMFEQTTTRIVASQQLVQALRAQHESLQESEADLRMQLLEMKQELTAMQARQDAGLLARIGRWFKRS